MFNARNPLPLSSAVAGGTARARGGDLRLIGTPDMAQHTASFPSYRGILR